MRARGNEAKRQRRNEAKPDLYRPEIPMALTVCRSVGVSRQPLVNSLMLVGALRGTPTRFAVFIPLGAVPTLLTPNFVSVVTTTNAGVVPADRYRRPY